MALRDDSCAETQQQRFSLQQMPPHGVAGLAELLSDEACPVQQHVSTCKLTLRRNAQQSCVACCRGASTASAWEMQHWSTATTSGYTSPPSCGHHTTCQKCQSRCADSLASLPCGDCLAARLAVILAWWQDSIACCSPLSCRTGAGSMLQPSQILVGSHLKAVHAYTVVLAICHQGWLLRSSGLEAFQ
jgi:hypothetical protein